VAPAPEQPKTETPVPQPPAPTPVETPPAQNNSTSSSASTPLANATNQSEIVGEKLESQYKQIFRRYSSGGLPPSQFCTENSFGELVQFHYKTFYGSECVTEKPGADGFAPISSFTSDKCQFVQCCVKGTSSAYSKKYDYLECGRN